MCDRTFRRPASLRTVPKQRDTGNAAFFLSVRPKVIQGLHWQHVTYTSKVNERNLAGHPSQPLFVASCQTSEYMILIPCCLESEELGKMGRPQHPAAVHFYDAYRVKECVSVDNTFLLIM